MPRPLRLDYENAWHHVFNRGAAKQNIFHTDIDRKLFLELLAEITDKFYIEIHAYCLMSNHFHLLIHTPKANLAKAMQYLLSIYTKKHNRMIQRDGPLLRGRYKSILIDADSYLLQVSRYIHLNPINANICKHPKSYKWSSYLSYRYGSKHSWLQTSFILKMVGGENPRKAYMQFHRLDIDRDIRKFYSKKHLSPILGSNSFKRKLTSL